MSYRLIRNLLFCLSPEAAHRWTVRGLATGLLSAPRLDHGSLRTTVCGLEFANPVGLAAGFDKDAHVPDALLKLGFGFVEVGTLTPKPQPGNPKPRMFRLVEDRAVVNRLGFNNGGHIAARTRLEHKHPFAGPVGVNIGANKDSADRIFDYVQGVECFASLADYLTVNISSPNTPGLRALQSRDALSELIGRVRDARRESGNPNIPIWLKVAPDLTAHDRTDIVDVLKDTPVDALIISNTTIERPANLRSPHRAEAGGLSGRPLMEKSTDLLRQFYGLLAGKTPLIGVGGVANGADAYAKIRAGASLVQLYTGLIYAGPGLVGQINRELATLLSADGFATIGEAVGVDHRR